MPSQSFPEDPEQPRPFPICSPQHSRFSRQILLSGVCPCLCHSFSTLGVTPVADGIRLPGFPSPGPLCSLCPRISLWTSQILEIPPAHSVEFQGFLNASFWHSHPCVWNLPCLEFVFLLPRAKIFYCTKALSRIWSDSRVTPA